MGSGIAQVAARAGHQVILIDANESSLERSRSGIASAFDKLVQLGKLSHDCRDEIAGRICWTGSLAASATAALVIEAIVENLQVKMGLFSQLEGIIEPEAVLASNTSSLSITTLSEQLDRPERFAGLHFFNPVPMMKLVEIIPGPKSDPSTIETLLLLMQSWGKVPVQVRDVPGFIVNRVARPYYAEGFAALAEGITAETIDHALQSNGGFRMGPLALTDMIGHDVNYAVAETVHAAYAGQTRFRPQTLQRSLVERGALGRKSGSGVYDYTHNLPQPAYVAAGQIPKECFVAEQQVQIEPLVAAAAAQGINVTKDSGLPDHSLRVGETVIALGDGRTLRARPDVDALLDHARDFASAPFLTVSARSEAAAAATAAFAAAIGKRVIACPDRPGQIVLRTLAQLANAAADAVLDNVASAEDIDAAMQFGANHPEGPLAWVKRTGHANVAAMLRNVADETGDLIYNPSPYLGQ
jgi:3-hydroxybutyryl-CoA dehydrogenase